MACIGSHMLAWMQTTAAALYAGGALLETIEHTVCLPLLSGVMQSQLTPAAVVERLDKVIVGQQDAKKAVAIAFRNR